VFSNCKILVTEQRIIIAQKVLWRDRYKVQYFVWFDNTEKQNNIENGMLHLCMAKDNCTTTEDLITLLPDDNTVITKLLISNFTGPLF
jgi:hypothetical protein